MTHPGPTWLFDTPAASGRCACEFNNSTIVRRALQFFSTTFSSPRPCKLVIVLLLLTCLSICVGRALCVYVHYVCALTDNLSCIYRQAGFHTGFFLGGDRLCAGKLISCGHRPQPPRGIRDMLPQENFKPSESDLRPSTD